MTGLFLLDWAVLAVSLFNLMLLLWLGVTVLLNADRKSWGILLAGGGLLMAASFFLIHSALLGLGLNNQSVEIQDWWQLGWLPIIISPFAWYAVVLWYAGFWDQGSALWRRQRWGFLLTGALALGLVVKLYGGKLLPSYSQILTLDLPDNSNFNNTLLLVGLYSLYNILCIGLALEALLNPSPSTRMMGDLARRRARPWFVGASVVLLFVSVLVGALIAILVLDEFRPISNPLHTIAAFDLLIASLIAAVVVMIGKAIVSYEIFTGQILPRRGFFRQWRRVVILAAGYSAVLAWSLAVPVRPIYALLLATLLLAFFYALSGARSFAEREDYMDQLRPLVSSQGLYDQLFAPATAPGLEIDQPFQALCENILSARLAYLHALGPLSAFVGQTLTYPANLSAPLLELPELASRSDSAKNICFQIEPERYAGAVWAVPLWSERGLSGLLLLGEKRDGGLYTQEEIEIARAASERLIDTQAGVELARRLVALQRQRLAESQVVDRRTRRVLHDDVLPRLHAAMLDVNGGTLPAAVETLAEIHRALSDLLRDLPFTNGRALERLGLVGALRELLEGEQQVAFDQVTCQVEPEAERRAQSLASLTQEVLFYAAREAIRNAARHGRQGDLSRSLHLCVEIKSQAGLLISIEDDGIGIGTVSPAKDGSGQGLALHSTLMAVIGGALTVESTPNQCTRLRIEPAGRNGG